MSKIFTELGLGGWEILFHVINLAILVVALYFLVYGPVKRIVAAHKKKLDDIAQENRRMHEENEALKCEYDEMKQKAVEESAAIGSKAMERSKEIVEEAHRKADAIVENAQKEALVERQRIQHELHDSVGHIAVEIAEKILKREVSEEDNKRIIDEGLSEWEK